MNRLWLKTVGCVVVVLAAAIAVYVFWPAKATEVAESKDTEQIQKPAEHKLATEARRPKFIKSRRLRRRLPIIGDQVRLREKLIADLPLATNQAIFPLQVLYPNQFLSVEI